MTGDYNWYYPGYSPEAIKQKDAYQYAVATGRPAFEIVRKRTPEKNPFKESDGLVDKIFNSRNSSRLDPLDFGADRMLLHGDHIDCLMKQLEARHVISYTVLNDIAFQESRVNSTLSEINDMPFTVGRGSKQGIDLEKQLARLSQERHAEEIACWRDTNRLIGSIFDPWTEYADERRKKRLMDYGL